MYARRNLTPEQFAALGYEAIQASEGRLVDLNLERNKLMSEIDGMFARGLATGKTEVNPRHKFQ